MSTGATLMVSKEHSPDERRLISGRKQNIEVFLLPSGRHFEVEAEIQDEIHHLRIRMMVNHPSMKIKKIAFEMPRTPDPVCIEAKQLAESLVGERAFAGLKWGKDENACNRGCLLLKDLFRAAATVLAAAQSNLSREELNGMFPGLTEDQLHKIWMHARPDLKDSCILYAEDSPFMQRLSEAEWPKGIEQLFSGVKR